MGDPFSARPAPRPTNGGGGGKGDPKGARPVPQAQVADPFAPEQAGGGDPFAPKPVESGRTKWLGRALGAAEQIVPAGQSPWETAKTMGSGFAQLAGAVPALMAPVDPSLRIAGIKSLLQGGYQTGQQAMAGDPKAQGAAGMILASPFLALHGRMGARAPALSAMEAATKGLPQAERVPGTVTGFMPPGYQTLRPEALPIAENPPAPHELGMTQPQQTDMFRQPETAPQQLSLFPSGGRLAPQPMMHGAEVNPLIDNVMRQASMRIAEARNAREAPPAPEEPHPLLTQMGEEEQPLSIEEKPRVGKRQASFVLPEEGAAPSERTPPRMPPEAPGETSGPAVPAPRPGKGPRTPGDMVAYEHARELERQRAEHGTGEEESTRLVPGNPLSRLSDELAERREEEPDRLRNLSDEQLGARPPLEESAADPRVMAERAQRAGERINEVERRKEQQPFFEERRGQPSLRGMAEEEAGREEAVQPLPITARMGGEGKFTYDMPGGQFEVEHLGGGLGRYRGALFGENAFTPEIRQRLEASIMEQHPEIDRFTEPDAPRAIGGATAFGNFEPRQYPPSAAVRAQQRLANRDAVEGRPSPSKMVTTYLHAPLNIPVSEALRASARTGGERWHVINDDQKILDSFRQKNAANRVAVREKLKLYDAKADKIVDVSARRVPPGTPGGTTLYSNPFADPKQWQAAFGLLKDIYKKLTNLGLPTDEQRLTKELISQHNAEYHLRAAQLERQAQPVEDAFWRMPESERMAFEDRVEHGLSQPDESLERAASYTQYIAGLSRKMVEQLGSGKLAQFISNYLPHLFQDPMAARRVFALIARVREAGATPEAMQALLSQIREGSPIPADEVMRRIGQAGTKRLGGPAGFLQHRELPFTLAELRSVFGIEPKTTNPIELARFGFNQTVRYVMGQKMFVEAQNRGLVKYFNSPEEAPLGQAMLPPEITSTKPTPQGGPSLIRNMGGWYAPESVARIFNRYLASGLQPNMMWRALRRIGGFLNSVNLGFSGFHFTTTSELAMQTDIANFGRSGDWMQLAKAPTAPARMWRAGSELQRMALDPALLEKELSEWPQEVQNVVKAGGRFQANPAYSADMTSAFKRALLTHDLLKGIATAPFAGIELGTHLIMRGWVPRLKLGAFQEIARTELEKLPPNADDVLVRRTLHNAWRETENRFGQVTYDNRFWSKTVQHLGFVFTRALGWTAGNIEMFGGAARDVARGEMSQRLAVTGAIITSTALFNALMTYANTGQAPDDPHDLIAYRTGRQNDDGTPERFWLPSVGRDLYNWVAKPFRTALGKLHPAVQDFAAMVQNKDWMGNMVRNPEDSYFQQGLQVLHYLQRQTVPISYQAMQREKQIRGAPPALTGFENFMGVQRAPQELQRTPAELEAQEIMTEHGRPYRTPEAAEEFGKRGTEQRALLHHDPGAIRKMVEMLRSGELSPKQANAMLARVSQGSPIVTAFRTATVEEAGRILLKANPTERRVLMPLYAQKLQNAAGSGKAEDVKKGFQLFRSLR
jgi:hypothetical protein